MGRLRRFLGLRQIDVELATGVAIHRLSLSERGLLLLSDAEQSLVSAYLRDRLKIVREVSSDRASPKTQCFRFRQEPKNAKALRSSAERFGKFIRLLSTGKRTRSENAFAG